MPEKKVLFVIAHEGYQPVEYAVPKKIIAAAGYRVETASNKAGTATAKDGSKAAVDILLSDVNVSNYDAIVFIGGSGAMDNLDTQESYELLRAAYSQEKIIGAICIAPRILAHAGILTDVHATGWDEDGQLSDVFNEFEVKYVKEPVVVDDFIVTATGPQAAADFGRELVELLKKQV